LTLSNPSRGLCPNINKDRQTWPLTLTNSGCTSAAGSEPFRWESKSPARPATGPATCREELPARTGEPSAVVSHRKHQVVGIMLLSCVVLRVLRVLRLPALSPCVSALVVRLWRFRMRSPPGEGANRDRCLSLETATRAKPRPRMGMRLLHRLIILMAYFIRRLGDTRTVVSMVFDVGVSG
jgi:hypothetical protein